MICPWLVRRFVLFQRMEEVLKDYKVTVLLCAFLCFYKFTLESIPLCRLTPGRAALRDCCGLSIFRCATLHSWVLFTSWPHDVSKTSPAGRKCFSVEVVITVIWYSSAFTLGDGVLSRWSCSCRLTFLLITQTHTCIMLLSYIQLLNKKAASQACTASRPCFKISSL